MTGGVRSLAWRIIAASPLCMLAADGPPAPTGLGQVPGIDEVAKLKGIDRNTMERMRKQLSLGVHDVYRLKDSSFEQVMERLDSPEEPDKIQGYRQQVQGSGLDKPAWTESHALAYRGQQALRTKLKEAITIGGIPVGPEVAAKKLTADPKELPLKEISPGGWVWLGPGNVGGRTRSLLIDPENPRVMWAGSVAGGVWITDDAGASWSPADDFMANLSVTCMARDPRTSATLYAGTGEAFTGDGLAPSFAPLGTLGDGVLRSSDGRAWEILPKPPGDAFAQINDLAIIPSGGGMAALHVATPRGIYRSLREERDDWVQTLDVPTSRLRFNPRDANLGVAGSFLNGRAYFTTDAGASWTKASHPGTGWSGRVELAYAAKNPSIVYASTYKQVGSGIESRLFRSTDGGRTYAERKTLDKAGAADAVANYLGGLGVFANAVWAGDPTDENLLIVGGLDLWRSLDGGDSFERISDWTQSPTSPHADHHVIVSSPDYDGAACHSVYFANDGGVYRADDVRTAGSGPERSGGWSNVNHGYGVTQFYGAAVDHRSQVVLAGAQDQGILRFDPAEGTGRWSIVQGGDGGYCASDPAPVDGQPAYLYSETNRLAIRRSADGGLNSPLINGKVFRNGAAFWKDDKFTLGDAKDGKANLIAPFILDPNEPNRLLAGGLRLWRTNNARAESTEMAGPEWAAIKPTIAPAGVTPSVPTHAISAIAVAPGDSDLIWVGYNNGEVWRTTDGTQASPNWERWDERAGGGLPDRFCTRLVVDASDTRRVYATLGGFFPDNLWTYREGDAGWSKLGELPPAPVRALTAHPSRPEWLYLGCEVGLLASGDGGRNWTPTNQGPTNCPVDDLVWDHQTLIVVTYGRGIYRIDLRLPAP